MLQRSWRGRICVDAPKSPEPIFSHQKCAYSNSFLRIVRLPAMGDQGRRSTAESSLTPWLSRASRLSVKTWSWSSGPKACCSRAVARRAPGRTSRRLGARYLQGPCATQKGRCSSTNASQCAQKHAKAKATDGAQMDHPKRRVRRAERGLTIAHHRLLRRRRRRGCPRREGPGTTRAGWQCCGTSHCPSGKSEGGGG